MVLVAGEDVNDGSRKEGGSGSGESLGCSISGIAICLKGYLVEFLLAVCVGAWGYRRFYPCPVYVARRLCPKIIYCVPADLPSPPFQFFGSSVPCLRHLRC
ncbi:hypothetical protein L2E82_27048 [Cichorium intybus]|uniref:Uncharacterized protein n=1 Tax=Cichorium intybus TaxID=13427 RepID=A0ACB9CSA1_CICIN|nr:hypothetical protein L2E82_27048 [Cichorium intybus]